MPRAADHEVTGPARFIEARETAWAREPALVRCPHCGRAAIVSQRERANVEPGERASSAPRFTCSACGHSVSAEFDAARWTGPVHLSASGRCGGCGQTVHRRIGRRARPPARRTAVVRCAGCGHATTLPLTMLADRGRDAVDPVFGLPLWLQVSCCGVVLWALNVPHLDFLADYVGATLRERAPNRNGSTASRLPKWMKEARHRAAIIDAIAGLRDTLVHAELREPAT